MALSRVNTAALSAALTVLQPNATHTDTYHTIFAGLIMVKLLNSRLKGEQANRRKGFSVYLHLFTFLPLHLFII
jgi:hypothetical protein